MKAKKILLNSLPLLFIGGIMAYAAAPTGGYLPNATLDPDCAPNDTDCFVQIAPELTSVWDNTDGSVADETGDINYTEGNVGIGTTSPSQRLDVVDNIDGSTRVQVMNTSDTANASAGHSIVGAGPGRFGYTALYPSGYTTDTDISDQLVIRAGNWVANGIKFWTGSGINADISFNTGGTGVANTDMIVKQNGNVGIGTTDPVNRLDVQWAARIGSSYDTFTAPRNGLIVEGRTGLGTDDPRSQLHVVATNTTVKVEQSGNVPVTFYRSADASSTARGQQLRFNFNNAGTEETRVNISASTTAAGGGSFEVNAMDAISGALSSRIFINEEWRMGLGTQLPSAKLHVTGTLMVEDGGEACGPARIGAIKFDVATLKHQGCDGTDWNNLY